jgi:hypothetical protein
VKPRPIWYTPLVNEEYRADAFFIGAGWLIRYEVDGARRWTWVFRLYWSNHFDRV